MIEKQPFVPQPLDTINSSQRRVSDRQTQELPLEVVVLLDVFSRIEARRRGQLHHEQKEVS